MNLDYGKPVPWDIYADVLVQLSEYHNEIEKLRKELEECWAVRKQRGWKIDELQEQLAASEAVTTAQGIIDGLRRTCAELTQERDDFERKWLNALKVPEVLELKKQFTQREQGWSKKLAEYFERGRQEGIKTMTKKVEVLMNDAKYEAAENERLREQLQDSATEFIRLQQHISGYQRNVAALMQVNANLRQNIHLMARALAGDKIEGIEDLWKSLSQEKDE